MRSFLSEIWAKLWKNALSHNVEESFQKFIDPDHDAVDLQNWISFSLSKDISLVKSSWSVVFMQKKTDRKVDKCQVKPNLLGRGNKIACRLFVSYLEIQQMIDELVASEGTVSDTDLASKYQWGWWGLPVPASTELSRQPRFVYPYSVHLFSFASCAQLQIELVNLLNFIECLWCHTMPSLIKCLEIFYQYLLLQEKRKIF